MSENTAKLNKLRKEIESCSENDAAAITEAAQKAADEALAAAEKEARREKKSDTRSAIEKFRTEERKRVSEARFSMNRHVLMHRTKLVDEFFLQVEESLKDKTSKEEYKEYLKRSISKAEDICSLEEAQVYCRREDIAVVAELLTGKGADITVSEDISIGGIIVRIPEKGVIMDLSIDAALEKEREQFSASKEMQL